MKLRDTLKLARVMILAACGLIATGADAQMTGASVSTTPACGAGSEGTATANFTGTPNGTVTYLWAPGGATTASITGLTAGGYSVTVSDLDSTFIANGTVGSNTPATANAGGPYSTCGTTAVNITATANGAGTWSGGAGTFGSASSLSTTYTPTAGEVGSTVVITWTTSDPDGAGPCAAVASNANVVVNALPTMSCPANSSVCISAAAFALSGATPIGGTYSGTGVSGGNFDPAVAGAGTHTITYSYTDGNSCTNTCTFDITVNALPVVTCPGNSSVCLTDPAFALSGGSPGGGTYSGTGVSAGNFDPAVAGAGAHTITYSYTDGNSCTNTCTFQITVTTPATVTCPANSSTCLNTPAFALTGGSPIGGTYSGTGVSGGNFDPAVAGVGTHTITYTYSAGGCTGSCTFDITVNALPIVTCPASSSVCINAPAFALTGGSPIGGTYSGTGVSAGNFDPAVAGAGAHTITYSYTDGNSCTNTCTYTIGVLAVPSLSFSSTIVNSAPGDGTATVTTSGGIGPFTYDWSPGTPAGDGTNAITGLTGGTWSVLVTDLSTGCSISGSVNVNARLSGVKVIGSGNYPTWAAAVDSLNLYGVLIGGGGVNFTGTLNETTPAGGYVIGAYANGSASDPALFTGSGSVITASAAHTVGSINDGIFKLHGADFVTLTGFTLQENPANTTSAAATNNMTEFGVALMRAAGSTTDGAQNNTIIGNTISLVRTYTNTFGVYSNVRHSTTAVTTANDITAASGANNNNKVYGNTISNVNMGVVFVGSGTAAFMDTGNDLGGSSALSGNTFTNWGGAGPASGYSNVTATSACFFLNQETNANVSWNTMTSATGIITTEVRGILHNYSLATPAAASTTTITNNTIAINSAATANTFEAIRTTNSSGGLGTFSAVTIDNNHIIGCAVTGGGSSQTLTGISNSYACNTLSISNNEIRSNTTTATSGGFRAIDQTAAVITTMNINGNQIGNASGGAITFSGVNTATSTILNCSSAANTCSLSISNNDFRGVNYAASGSASINFIVNSAPTILTNVNGNTFTSLSLNISGAFVLLTNGAARPLNAVCNVSGNSIVGSLVKGQPGGICAGMFNNTAPLGVTTENWFNNNLSNITVFGSTQMIGLQHNASCVKNIYNNTFSNWTCGTNTVNALSVGGGLAAPNPMSMIYNNTVSNITTASPAQNYGIVTGTTGTQTFENNTVTGLVGANITLGGFLVQGATYTKVTRNTVCNLQCNLTTGLTVGMLLQGSTGTIDLTNNVIGDLRAPASQGPDQVQGIRVANTAGTVNLYYNTVNLTATSSSSPFGTSAVSATSTGSTLNMRNNILINNSAQNGIGIAAAYRRANTTLTTYAATSNNNLFYAGTPGPFRLIFFDGTNSDQTLASFQTRVGAPRDVNSVTQNITFLSTSCGSANFLRVDGSIPNFIESAGAVISTDTVDVDNQVRFGQVTYVGTGAGTDIGADEFAGTNPNICNAMPTPGTISGPLTQLCDPTTSTNLSLVGATVGQTGVTYQWKKASISGGPYSNLGTSLTQATGVLTDTAYYICIVTCANVSLADTTPEFAINVGKRPNGIATNGGAICEGDTLFLFGDTLVTPLGGGTPTYCAATSSCTFPDIITNVTFAGINNTTACGGVSGYNDFTAQTATVVAGTPTAISVSTGGDVEGIAVWIDYDRNGTFAAGELVLNGYLGTNPATYTGSVTVPLSTLNGPTRMRVRCAFAGDPSVTPGPCGSTTFGEIEDYTVNITGGTAPVLPELPAGPFTWTWAGPSSFSSSTQDPQILNATIAANAGTYTLTVASGVCADLTPATTAVTLNPGVNITSVTANPNPACEGGNTNLSFNATGLTPPGSYCVTGPFFTTGCTFPDVITNVSFAGISNNTGLTCTATSAPIGYNNFTAIQGNVVAGGSYSITVSTGGDNEGITVWIDWDADYLFEASEVLVSGYAGTNPATYTNATYVVPLTAVNGARRMRVRANYASNPITTPGPCGSVTFGEIEDYTINVTGGYNAGSISWTPTIYLDNPAASSPNAIGILTPETYQVLATNAGGCSDSATVSVTLNQPVDAGLDGSNTVCSLDPTFDMFTLLGGTPDAGGFWLTPGNAPHSNIFDPAVDAGGCYKYVVIAPVPCPNDTALVCVTNNIAPTYYADVDNDGFGDAAVDSVACTQPVGYVLNNTDLCPNDPLKQAPGVCGCGVPDIDTDGDGILDCLDNCPTVFGVIGSYCNDGNPATINDQLDGTCTCVGIPNPCAGQAGVLTMQTDNNGLQTGWQILSNPGATVVCSGSGFPNNSTIVLTCCLANGCYDLRVTDSFGDGMTTGGFVLRDGTNNRIIDAAGNGSGFTTTSQAALPFCVPLGSVTLTATSCDQMNMLYNSLISVNPDPAVSATYGVGNQTDDGYQYWIFNPHGGYTRRIFLNHTNGAGPLGPTRSATLSLTQIVTSPVPQYVLLNLRVRSMVNGVYNEFGPACRMMINPNLPCVATQLTTTANPVISCGQNPVYINGGVLWANNVANANKYQFKFTRPGYTRVIASNSRALTLAVWATQPLLCGLTYDVQVRPSYDGGVSYCPYGPTCQITTEACAPFAGGNEHMATQGSTEGFVMWPNPNRGDQLYLSLDGISEDVTTAEVIINDLFGKLVRRELIALEGSTTLNKTLELDPSMANGVYTVTVTAGNSSFTKRLVLE